MSAHINRFFVSFSAFSLCLGLALSAQNQNSTDQPETVCVRVSVTDPLNRDVIGLEREHFRIYEDNTEQTIASFNISQSVPMGVGIVWDVGRSLDENYESAKNMVSRLLFPITPNLDHQERAKNEYFLINFSEAAPIQRISGKMPTNEVLIDKSKKRIALLDAVYIGLDQIHQSKHDRGVLIIISDGVETYGQHKESEILEYARKLDFQIFGIVKYDPNKTGPSLNRIRNMVEITGGGIYFPNGFMDIDHYIDRIHAGLQHPYLLCYMPTNDRHDGKLRKIEIKLDPPLKLPVLNIHARKERCAPKN